MKIYEVVRTVDGKQFHQGFFQSVDSAMKRYAECVEHSATVKFAEAKENLGIKSVFHGILEHEVKP